MTQGGDIDKNALLLVAEADSLYRSGSYEKAHALYLRAAEAGLPHACFKIGQMYHYGTGVTVDYKKAIYYYRMAAERHNISACYSLALMYGSGEGIEKNTEEALRWMRRGKEGNRKK